MKKAVFAIRSLALFAILFSSLFAGSALADDDITGHGSRLTTVKGNDKNTISVEFRGIPAEYEGWNATVPESLPACGVVTNGIVNCEFDRPGSITGTWLHLYKAPDLHASFYVSFYVPGMEKPAKETPVSPKPEETPDPCIDNPECFLD